MASPTVPTQGCGTGGVGMSGGGGDERRAKIAWGLQDGGPLPERSANSVERFKDECLRLKVELADRREETRQLQQRVRLLEGSLQVRMHHLETLVEELRKAIQQAPEMTAKATEGNVDTDVAADGLAGSDGRRLAELLDRIINEARRTQVVLHAHADVGARLEAKDRLLEKAQHERQNQDLLKDQLIESQQETRRLAAKVRSSEHSSLRQKLDHAKRSARKQDELLAEYERTQHDLHDRMQILAVQLEDERRARREHEGIARRLAAQLEEHLGGDAVSFAVPSTMLGAASTGSLVQDITARSASPVPRHDAGCGTGGSGASALRRELDALRDEERAARRLRRRRRSKEVVPQAADDGGGRGSVGGGFGERSEAAACAALCNAFRNATDRESALRAELAAAERRGASLEEGQASERWTAQAEQHFARMELEVTEKQVVASEALAEDLARAEGELWGEVRMAECRAWTFLEVANEIAWRADLRELECLQGEVGLQQELQAAEYRCATMTAVANGLGRSYRV
eukprot:CAMPEP_0117526350 /NCGR_PEP_ID=MMETSP0784-20121206/36239_1 /TAXON_ID=39447 /ORGANISM="" /LENGTH=518 /DNA_ID=CAMNT_0005322573 /DNA_START=37 /DNA_END=1591 /DNA_ORIENTATION=-